MAIKRKTLKGLKAGTPVVVHWFDANRDQTDFQGSVEEVTRSQRLELKDIGFFVAEKGEYVTISQEMFAEPGGDFKHIHHIPRVNIITVKVLYEIDSGRTDNPLQQVTEGVSGARDGVRSRKRAHGDGGVADNNSAVAGTEADLGAE